MKVLRLINYVWLNLLLIGLLGWVTAANARTSGFKRVNVQLVTDEAEAVLSILEKKRMNVTITEEDWRRLFATEGYVRLKRREASMRRDFTDDEFKAFVLSDKLASNAAALQKTLVAWKRASVNAAANRALAYLPEAATIRAKIYPAIKPRENSFVFEVKSDPAIFLYLNPEMTREQFENTLAHELHHIGFGTSCPEKKAESEIAGRSKNDQELMKWLSAFGEGFAMLAAAGGPNIHPHKFSKAEDRARWDRDVANYESDFHKVEQFFLDVLGGKLSEEETRNIASSFFGVQGPWYTVGWKMATMIEKTYGRAKLIECICDQRIFLATYNQAAMLNNRKTGEPLPLSSETLVKATRGS